MKTKYIKPVTEIVIFNASDSILDDNPSPSIVKGSHRTMRMDTNTGYFDGQDEGNNNFWDD